jgi:hypothetical protein
MKTTIDHLYSVNKDKSLEGVWITIGYNAKQHEVKIKVAQAGNPKHESIQRKYAKALEKSRHNDGLRRLTLAKITGEALLLDWENIIDEDGNSVEATVEARIESLTKFTDFFLEVLDAANDITNFQDDVDIELKERFDEMTETPEQDTEKN